MSRRQKEEALVLHNSQQMSWLVAAKELGQMVALCSCLSCVLAHLIVKTWDFTSFFVAFLTGAHHLYADEHVLNLHVPKLAVTCWSHDSHMVVT